MGTKLSESKKRIETHIKNHAELHERMDLILESGDSEKQLQALLVLRSKYKQKITG